MIETLNSPQKLFDYLTGFGDAVLSAVAHVLRDNSVHGPVMTHLTVEEMRDELKLNFGQRKLLQMKIQGLLSLSGKADLKNRALEAYLRGKETKGKDTKGRRWGKKKRDKWDKEAQSRRFGTKRNNAFPPLPPRNKLPRLSLSSDDYGSDVSSGSVETDLIKNNYLDKKTIGQYQKLLNGQEEQDLALQDHVLEVHRRAMESQMDRVPEALKQTAKVTQKKDENRSPRNGAMYQSVTCDNFATIGESASYLGKRTFSQASSRDWNGTPKRVQRSQRKKLSIIDRNISPGQRGTKANKIGIRESPRPKVGSKRKLDQVLKFRPWVQRPAYIVSDEPKSPSIDKKKCSLVDKPRKMEDIKVRKTIVVTPNPKKQHTGMKRKYRGPKIRNVALVNGRRRVLASSVGTHRRAKRKCHRLTPEKCESPKEEKIEEQGDEEESLVLSKEKSRTPSIKEKSRSPVQIEPTVQDVPSGVDGEPVDEESPAATTSPIHIEVDGNCVRNSIEQREVPDGAISPDSCLSADSIIEGEEVHQHPLAGTPPATHPDAHGDTKNPDAHGDTTTPIYGAAPPNYYSGYW